ncbi:MAG: hypothetical protein PW734_08295 [Verrucomicrobium sp.]|nr:hypothetical protein [Verrucomicrobium sp.]
MFRQFLEVLNQRKRLGKQECFLATEAADWPDDDAWRQRDETRIQLAQTCQQSDYRTSVPS